jgi:hypothetical protein
MNASDARQVLLVRAYEAPCVPPWTPRDAEAATREAARAEGEATAEDRFLARRARLAVARLAEREPAVARALAPADRGWIGVALVLLAFAAGVATDAVGQSQRINILAPPLLALMAWNLLVYVAIVLRLRAPGPVRRAMASALERGGGGTGPLGRYGAEWARVSAPLQAARAAAVLHAAAAALVLGVLASLYLRGLVLAYSAGWESTFLDASRVHALLSAVLGPASRLTGVPLPGVAQLDALRFPGGENAARWIHLHAVTAAAVVVVPRVLLALAAAWRVRRLASNLPLPLNDAYYRGLLRMRSGRAAPVFVLPYSYQLPDELRPGLQRALERHLGTPVRVDLADTVSAGSEETVPVPMDGHAPVALLALSATPERETHGRFVQALAQRAAEPTRVLVLVDESAFRLRYGANRLAERREAWQRMLNDVGHEPVFADLSA